jgi:hypothetical protein
VLLSRVPPRVETGRLQRRITPGVDKRNSDAWMRWILNASRKGLRTQPDTAEVWELWLSYKRAAHDIWRAQR